MQTVELLGAAELEAAVRAAWERLAAAGLPSLAGHPHATNRPHVTVAAADRFTPVVRRRLDAAVAAALPLDVRLCGLHHFGHRGSLVWLLHPDAALRAAHAEVWRVLEGVPRRDPRYAPGGWTPHLSLALRLPADRAPDARAVLAGAMPVVGALVAARSYDGTTRTVSPLGDASSGR
ncbi:2'-5' RNA ligase superfamily protein [Micromonospora pattaloongensis]|uniref:2'-5' RNA ligase superfamily protein n=1 Tax=Micromonospora pattaloongensis TaxID=405436 RepID=A0A1H3PGM4_9ACTN|nr:2'-5' RNA ligase family protein [Micromonospora pattaloongensis]SDY99559.1 2'-5' RNA ligase superfamily protein [Micromonospora pattaloongensis]